MMRITDAVKNLIIVNVLFYIGSRALDGMLRNMDMLLFKMRGGFGLAAYYIESELFQPFQVATHMFMHGSIQHLFFNMFGLYMFGTVVESRVGIKNFLILFFISGLGALALQNAAYAFEIYINGYQELINASMLGASGALMGIYAASAVFFPNMKVFLLFPPIPIKLKYLVIAFIAIDLFQGMGGFSTGIAHFAHIGGALVGFLISMYWKRSGYV